jgi:universal stress protein family protein
MSRLSTNPAKGLVDSASAPDDRAARRIAVVFERGHAGAAALREAAERATAGAELSVVTLAPQARAVRRAGGEGPYNIAIRDEAQLELREARDLLGSVATRATFNVLSGCPQPPLASWVAEHGFDLVVLPRQRLTPGGNYFAKSLRKETSAEVLLVR